ncbi:MAG: hypothetical protein IPK85_05560 [Gemmatimonadetes bacterium]|nr:hypothetical protein [Gemmatimonadota bacterium]
MFLFKASGQTYLRVVKQSLHAFPYRPREVEVGQVVLLSKNREDCTSSEAQIQFVAKILAVRPATTLELDAHFPGVSAGERFGVMVELYWMERLDRPFNLSQVLGPDHKFYNTVQDYSLLKDADELKVFGFLVKNNPRVVLSYLNRDDLPEKLVEYHDSDAG